MTPDSEPSSRLSIWLRTSSGIASGNAPVNVLEKPAQCGVDYALQFASGRQFHLPVPEPLAGVIKENGLQCVPETLPSSSSLS